MMIENNDHINEPAFSDRSGPKWLDDLMSEYFNDDVGVVASSRFTKDSNFLRRGRQKALGAHAICRLREPLRVKLIGISTDNTVTLVNLLRQTAREIDIDLAIVSQWLDPMAGAELEQAVEDPAGFARLAIALGLPLERAIQLFRANGSSVRTLKPVSTGAHDGEPVSDIAASTGDSTALAVLRNCYNERPDID